MPPPTNGQIASPRSTGGAGTFFEQHVGAYWFAQLLLGGIPPIIIDCTVDEVSLRTEHLGWNTDDFLVIGCSGSGAQRKLLGQVKQAFTVSANDEVCKAAILDFWKDFNNIADFSAATDRMVLVVLRGTNTLLEHFSGLLDCARAARDANEFEHFLATPGRLNAKSVAHCEVVRSIVADPTGPALARADLWSFLRLLHVLSLDLTTATSQAEAAITSTLAYAAPGQDAVGSARTTWNDLLRLSSEAMGQSRSYKRDDLPLELRQRHAPINSVSRSILRRLNEHSLTIRSGLRCTIGPSLRLDRVQPVLQTLQRLASHQAVLVTGAAGSGKSCVAMQALSQLATDHFTFCFRAEEFATQHLDVTLGMIQAQATATTLRAALANQTTKVVLIESVERLLEQDTREAFNDFLGVLIDDPSWKVILTCRDYSTDTVRSAFLDGRGIPHATVSVPPLDDAELTAVQTAYPALARPLAALALRALLRNPYILDKAERIPWGDGRPLPQTERDFRDLFWKALIRAEARTAHAMPRRREQNFVDITLRRARSLSPFASSTGLDPEALDALIADSLLLRAESSPDLLAPAHDVLEDWAILRWIDQRHQEHASALNDFATALGTHPAVRRTYRKWVSELVALDAVAAAELFRAVLRGQAGAPHFQDDTIVSLLRSPSSGVFLDEHSSDLRAHDRKLLHRVIHLLRVACMTAPAGPRSLGGATFLVPDGAAWANVLNLVHANLAAFREGENLLLLGLVEDWSQSITVTNQRPNGDTAAAAIAYRLVDAFDDYSSDNELTRTLEIITKIPNADPVTFSGLMRNSDEEREGRATHQLLDLVLEGTSGHIAARDQPDVVIAAAREFLVCQESDLGDERHFGGAFGLGPLFGLKPSREHGYFPASAYRGPFLSLLRHHPRKALDFYIEIFNHSAEWYAHPRVHAEYVEAPEEITLTFSDGTTQRQWCNGRMWCWYRELSVGCYALHSMLMAFERWLKEVAESEGAVLDAVLVTVLRRSISGALTSVCAAIANAYPDKTGETLLTLLRSPTCIHLDRERYARESVSAVNPLSGLLARQTHQFLKNERREANAWAHRRIDLEGAILRLQFGSLKGPAQEIIDQHRAAMPPRERWGDDDRLWSLALDRMDLRRYRATDLDPAQATAIHGSGMQDQPQRMVRLDLAISEPNVQALVNERSAITQLHEARLGRYLWGQKAFAREADADALSQWRIYLQGVRANTDSLELEDHDLGREGPGIIAAVCIRDHWADLTDDEKDWCVTITCTEIARRCDSWSPVERMQRGMLSADRTCASVIAGLLRRVMSASQYDMVRATLIMALTHAITEVRAYAANGVGTSRLWEVDRDVVFRILDAIATEAIEAVASWDIERQKPHHNRKSRDQCEAEAARHIRNSFWTPTAIAAGALQSLNGTTWMGAEANQRILTILRHAPGEPAANESFSRLAVTLAAWWDADARRRDNYSSSDRNHESETGLSLLLAEWCLKVPSAVSTGALRPLIDAIDRLPGPASNMFLHLIEAADRLDAAANFWPIWEQYAAKAASAAWLGRIDREHASGTDVIDALFLSSIDWNDDIRHWKCLDGHAHHLHALFMRLPPSAVALKAYTSFLYKIGDQSLPDAFILLSQRLREGGVGLLTGKSKTRFILETLLKRHVYRQPKALKRTTDLRDSVLALLDLLVDNGSSLAFRMRDDFVTPPQA